MMTTVAIAGLAGFTAQLVNGSLGMGYGTITMTFLLGMSIAPAVASASVNVATAATDLVSGIAHHKLGNVHWPTALWLGIPGAVGGFAGAFALSSLTGLDAATPVTSAILICLGAALVWRFTGRRRSAPASGAERPRTGMAGPTGLVAGFLNAVGGGGWGPVTMPVMLSSSRLAPHQVVGSASVAEFPAAAAAVAGFWVALPGGLTVLWPLVVGMAAGGMIAAPAAAWLTRKLPTQALGSTIGMLVIALNLRTLLGAFEAPWPVVTVLYLALAGVWALVAAARPARRREPAEAGV